MTEFNFRRNMQVACACDEEFDRLKMFWKEKIWTYSVILIPKTSTFKRKMVLCVKTSERGFYL